MRQEHVLLVLTVVLALVRLPAVQAQEAGASKVESDAAAKAAARYEEIRRHFDEGDAAAQYKIAERYRLGSMLERNYPRAIVLYRLSAKQGFAPSQYRLGQIYQEGKIVEQDLQEAIKYYRSAAEQGHVDAQYALAQMYHLGKSVERDMAVAIGWYRRAAQQGDDWSQLALGDEYRLGLVVPRNPVLSTMWYRMAAAQGNIFAQHAMGDAYRFGSGVEKDIPQAIAWYRMAADAGNPSSERALAELESEMASTEPTTAPEPTAEVVERQDEAAAVEQETGPQPEIEVAQDPAAKDLGSGEIDIVSAETIHVSIKTGQRAERPSEPEVASRVSIAVQSSEGPEPVDEPSITAAAALRDDAAVSHLVAQAKGQVARLALTTPVGDNAYATYRQVLFLQPNNVAAREGIQAIGVKYAELARSAADKGDPGKAKQYAAKALQLAPEHPSVQALVMPAEATGSTSETTSPTFETVVEREKTSQRLPERRPDVAARIETANLSTAAVMSEGSVQDADDLVFKPHNYAGRAVVVTGPITRFLWRYRLLSETGQNNIVLDIEGLGQAARAKLDAALEEAGAFGQIRVRIKGKIKRQSLATFHLAATELALIGFDPSQDALLGEQLDPDREITPLIVPVYPGKLFEPHNGRDDSGGRDSASPSSGGSGESGPGGDRNSSGGTGGAGGASSDGAGSADGGGNGKGNGNGNGKG